MSDGVITEIVEYDRRKACDPQTACKALTDALAGSSEQKWIECARELSLRGDMAGTEIALSTAMAEHPESVDVRYALAGTFHQTGRFDAAEDLLKALLINQPGHAAASFLLARLLMDQGRLRAAATVLRSLFNHGPHDVDLIIQAVELLDESGRQADAAAICEAEINSGAGDPRLHAYAGMLQIQLGEFTLARDHYGYALANDKRALEWNIPTGLSSLQRYENIEHPDIDLFRNGLKRFDLNAQTRASLKFALGKAHDDVGDYATAAGFLREANGTVHKERPWSRKNWRRAVEARLSSTPRAARTNHPHDWTPVFVVGTPRSGTTLVAELLSRYSNVCNRGELVWLPRLAQQISFLHSDKAELLNHAASIYEAQSRQDDSSAHWFIDKQPLNIVRIDLILAMWPNARIIYCERNARDTALSLWFQHFVQAEQDYAYDFTDIATVIKDCRRLADHAAKRHAGSVYKARYEDLVSDPARSMDSVAAWLGLSKDDQPSDVTAASTISTGSLWQARQPIYKRSVDRWRNYERYIPELLRLPAK